MLGVHFEVCLRFEGGFIGEIWGFWGVFPSDFVIFWMIIGVEVQTEFIMGEMLDGWMSLGAFDGFERLDVGGCLFEVEMSLEVLVGGGLMSRDVC